MVRPQLAQQFLERDDENVRQCLRLVIGTADEADEGRRFVRFQPRPSPTLVRGGADSCRELSSRFRRFSDLQALILPHIAINVHYV